MYMVSGEGKSEQGIVKTSQHRGIPGRCGLRVASCELLYATLISFARDYLFPAVASKKKQLGIRHSETVWIVDIAIW